ncbi:hypothetical protein Tco_1533476 [Tanacetum coccineum]
MKLLRTPSDKEIAKLMALISTSFKKIYKPTINNLRTSLNTRNKNIDNTLRSDRKSGYERQTRQYENQRTVNVAGNRDTISNQIVQQTVIQCYNCKGFWHTIREYKLAKRVKDYSNHKDKMLICKQEEVKVQLSAKLHDWILDSNEEPTDQELEAHYMYMAKIPEVIPAADEGTRPVFDKEPMEQVHTNDEYDVFVMENEHPEQPESINDSYVVKQCDSNTTPDSSNMSNNGGEADHDEQKF